MTPHPHTDQAKPPHGLGQTHGKGSNLRLVGYDYVLSMEHEDSLMSLREGLEKGVGFLRDLVLTDERGKPWFES